MSNGTTITGSNRVASFISSLTAIGPLPAFCLTTTVAMIWILAGFGVGRFSTMLHEDGTAIHTAWLTSLGIWLVPKKVGEVIESNAKKAEAQAVTAKAEAATAEAEISKGGSQ